MNELHFVPLGGSGEIGMNLNLYGYDNQWIMVDCGMMIDSSDGVDQIFVPDVDFLKQKNLLALILTHAHEDHIGGITDLWQELRCPLYTTPFTAAVIRRKLRESKIKEHVPIKVQVPGGKFKLGENFACELVPVTHSTVESQSLLLTTPKGRIFHTGDWKLDPQPLVGKDTAKKRIQEIGNEGVLAVIGDSTNAQIDGHSGSEFTVRTRLRELVLAEKGRVICTSFSSNIARLMTFFNIAQETQRNIVLIGRSLKRMVSAAQETGYIPRDLSIVPPREAMYLPPERLLLVCTGSQGEARAGLARIAGRSHPDIYLEEGDTVFFSSKVIPGNENEIEQLKKGLRRLGVKTIDEDEEYIHVSGHPCRDELKLMYQWLKPQILIPVHGYPPHLKAHAELGESCDIPHVIEVRNGDIVHLDEYAPSITGSIPTGRRLRIEQEWPPRSRSRGRESHAKKLKDSPKVSSNSVKKNYRKGDEKYVDQWQESRQSFLDSFRKGRH